MIDKTKSYLDSRFEMKDMGETSYVLGIKISRDQGSRMLYLDQERYFEKILKRFEIKGCKPVDAPTAKGQNWLNQCIHKMIRKIIKWVKYHMPKLWTV